MKKLTPLCVVFLTVFILPLSAGPPEGWWTGNSGQYKTGVDRSDPAEPAAFIESVVPEPDQFTALNQTFSAENYRGKRVRLRGSIRTLDVANWAGFWLRADSADNKIVAFENMQKRGISGTSPWTPSEIVIDIPEDADKIYIGLILDGKGKAWMKDLEFEIVDPSVATTGNSDPALPKAPVNLDFKEE